MKLPSWVIFILTCNLQYDTNQDQQHSSASALNVVLLRSIEPNVFNKSYSSNQQYQPLHTNQNMP